MVKWGALGIFIGVASLKILLFPTALIEGGQDLPAGISEELFKLNPTQPPVDVINLRVLIVADEEYRRHMKIFGMGWREEALIVLERADDAFYRDFGINFVATGFKEWSSDDRQTDGIKLLKEAQSELHWEEDKENDDILLVFTGQDIQDYAGWAEHYLGSPNADAVILQHQFDLWQRNKDWHVLQEELSHLFGAPDHVTPNDPIYWREDIMSYKWLYYTDKWDVFCQKIIMKNRLRFSRVGS